jgi:hypothetical protein
MSQLDDVVKAAKALDPDDRLRLVARLWESMPPDHWAAPRQFDRKVVRSMLEHDDLGGLSEVPRRMAWQIVGSPREKIYSAPRRFDLATIFVVTFAYSLLFALMSGINLPPVASLIVGGYITIVGIGQAALFGGQNARVASMITGAVAIVPITWLSMMLTPRGFRGQEPFVLLPAIAILGIGIGYIAGVLVGGVFLVADKLRKLLGSRFSTSGENNVEIVESDAD